MTDLDLVIRQGTGVTASDSVRRDVGVRAGKVVALAENLGGRRVIDASRKLVRR